MQPLFLLINHIAFLTNIRGTQLFIIILVVLLLFGSKRLPDVARSLGKAIKEFKKSAMQVESEFKEALNEKEPTHMAQTKSPQEPLKPDPKQTTV